MYPPFHYYVLAVLYLPFEIGARLGVVDIWGTHSYLVLRLLARGASVLMAVGTVYVVYLCCLELGKSRLAGLCSAFLVALMPPFLFYAKLSNPDVPYVFWFSLSLLYYIRAVRTDQAAAYVRFAITGMLAVCTKDQAYGFYVLPALHLIWRRYQAVPEPRLVPHVRRFLLDRPLRLAATAAGLVFLIGQNLPFNFGGFADHVGLILGNANEEHQIWERTIAGHLTMAWEALGQLSWSLSWPAFLVCAAGVVYSGARGRRDDLFVLLPVVSYYVFFISVVMHHFDRFFLGVCLILALYGGPVIAGLLQARTGARWKRFGVTGFFENGGARIDHSAAE